jgi:hypothetical protein
LKRVLIDSIDESVKNYFFINGFPDEETMLKTINREIDKNRLEGVDWPQNAHTMIGLKRLDNLHKSLDYIRENKISGDIIETGVWRGGACIFMKFYCDLYNLNKKIFRLIQNYLTL